MMKDYVCFITYMEKMESYNKYLFRAHWQTYVCIAKPEHDEWFDSVGH